MVNSRLSHFTAAPSALEPEGLHVLPERPFSRSYGAILPSSLTRVLPITLGILYPPTCVGLGTGTPTSRRGFSWRHDFRSVRSLTDSASRLGLNGRRICLPAVLRGQTHDDHRLGLLILPRPPFGDSVGYWYWNVNRLSIAYAFRPRLRVPTNPEWINFTQEPLGHSVEVSHSCFRYSCRHTHFPLSTDAYAPASPT